MMNIKESIDLLLEKRSFVFVALTKQDGDPHVTPVWFDLEIADNDTPRININVATGRVKSREIRIGSKLALAIMDPDNPYRFIGFYGIVTEIISNQKLANTHKDKLAKKYLELNKFPYYNENEKRIKISIELIEQYANKKGQGKN